MSYKAFLITISEIKKLEDHILPFVNFKAGLDGRVTKKNDIVAILQVEDIESYYTVFLDGKTTLKYVEDELSKMDTKMDENAKKELSKYLKC